MVIVNNIVFVIDDLDITCDAPTTHEPLLLNVDMSYDDEFARALSTSIRAINPNININIEGRILNVNTNINKLMCELLHQYVFNRIVDLSRLINVRNINDKHGLFTRLLNNEHYQLNMSIIAHYQRCQQEALVCITIKGTFNNIYYANMLLGTSFTLKDLDNDDIAINNTWFTGDAIQQLHTYMNVTTYKPIPELISTDIRRTHVIDKDQLLHIIARERKHPLSSKHIQLCFNNAKTYDKYISMHRNEQTTSVRVTFTLQNNKTVIDTDKINIIRRFESVLYNKYIIKRLHSALRAISAIE